MFKIFFAFLMVSVLGAMPVHAQEAEPSASEIITMVKGNLNLTQGQLASVIPVIEKYSSASEKLRDNLSDDANDRKNIRRQMDELKEDEVQELSQVLSDDQLSQWKKMARDWYKISADTNNEVSVKPMDQSTPPFAKRTAQ